MAASPQIGALIPVHEPLGRLGARGYHGVLKLARTTAHLAEVLPYRPKTMMVQRN